MLAAGTWSHAETIAQTAGSTPPQWRRRDGDVDFEDSEFAQQAAAGLRGTLFRVFHDGRRWTQTPEAGSADAHRWQPSAARRDAERKTFT